MRCAQMSYRAKRIESMRDANRIDAGCESNRCGMRIESMQDDRRHCGPAARLATTRPRAYCAAAQAADAHVSC